ncbi:hypothetical protein LPB67_01195 [Undibacterium sp. Jales W-56]|uniref:hypothetical protein n=1 Tax=Undibacterium sp. Jales W-56 TaxID=2897325 RepID=UPI0021D0035D|nr:hypothetical protein [Undibacterium sp. Jales W-56]MCU6432390.1 hypothetical protein [Undibacterium sp. Jales W-56]
MWLRLLQLLAVFIFYASTNLQASELMAVPKIEPCVRECNSITISKMKNLVASVRKPTTPLEILANVKFAFDHHLMLDENFLTESNLIHMFGGGDVKLNRSSDGVSGEVFNFGKMFKSTISGSAEFPGFSLAFNRTLKNVTSIETRFFMHISVDSEYTFEEVERVLGKGWKETPRLIFFETRIPPPTNPHGNAHIEYDVHDGRIDGNIEIFFGPNGMMEVADFKEKINNDCAN